MIARLAQGGEIELVIRSLMTVSRFLDELFVLLPNHWKIPFLFVTQEYKPPEGVSSFPLQVASVAVAGCQDCGQIGMALAHLTFTFGAQRDSNVRRQAFHGAIGMRASLVALRISSNSLEQSKHKET